MCRAVPPHGPRGTAGCSAGQTHQGLLWPRPPWGSPGQCRCSHAMCTQSPASPRPHPAWRCITWCPPCARSAPPSTAALAPLSPGYLLCPPFPGCDVHALANRRCCRLPPPDCQLPGAGPGTRGCTTFADQMDAGEAKRLTSRGHWASGPGGEDVDGAALAEPNTARPAPALAQNCGPSNHRTKTPSPGTGACGVRAGGAPLSPSRGDGARPDSLRELPPSRSFASGRPLSCAGRPVALALSGS